MKILGSDYDGTLNHGGISEAKCAAIRKWREKGHKFGIISGRGAGFRQEVLRDHPLLELDFFAACNGGLIVDGEGRVLYEARCETVSASKLTADLSAWGCKYIHINGERYWCAVAKAADRPSWVSPEDICLVGDMPAVEFFHQVSTQVPTDEEAAALVLRIREVYGEWLNPLQNGTCIDIVPQGVNKALGLYRVMELFGGAYEDMIAVGDNINDTDMIREFRSYAMESGVEAIKEMADGVVSDVVELIEKEI